MKRTTSILLAGSLLVGLGASVFFVQPAASGAFGGSEPEACGTGLDCTSDTFTAADATGPGFACTSVLASCFDSGPGSCNSVTTDGTGALVLGGTACSPTIKIGGTGNITITGTTITNANGGLDMNNNAAMQNSAANKALWVNETDGLLLNPFSATPTCAAGNKGTFSVDSDDSRGYFCDGTTVQRLGFSLVASASLDFASMADNADASATMTVTGAATTDAVSCNPTAAIEAGIQVAYSRVSSANTVTVVVHNGSGGVVDPAAATYACAVVR